MNLRLLGYRPTGEAIKLGNKLKRMKIIHQINPDKVVEDLIETLMEMEVLQ